MEAVGRLAGGVAHDFNNMLNVILGYVDLALRRVKSVDPICKNLIEIRHAAERSADLTRRLLGFSRRQAIAPRVLDLNHQMTGMEGLLRRIIGEDIALELVLGPDLWPVCLDPSQVDQVLANLSVNARDAMPDGGKLTIVTGNVTLDEAYCAVHADARPGDYALLAVRDTGCGMDARTLERAFEPFFTTKPEGQGTGLGLAMVYGIARQNGGSVEIESELGKGTTFRLYLPRLVEGREPRAEPLVAPVGAPPRGHETILLVEDEVSLRELAQELLEEMGYRVLAAASPGEGISLAETEQGAIDLLLTDVVMPVMNGKELSERIRTLRPHIRVLFTSGYTADVIAHRGVLDAGVQLLEKPFTLDTLARQVRQALGRP
jgi:CheY-like chemotaxis protein